MYMLYVGLAIEYCSFLSLDEITSEQFASWLVIFDVTHG